MKNLSLITLLLFTSTLFGQYTMFYGYEWETDYLRYRPIQYSPVKNVDQISFTINKRGKEKGTAIKKFNKDGYVTEFTEFKNGKEEESITLAYNENNKIQEIKHLNKGEVKRKTVFQHKDDKKPLSVVRYNRKNKIDSKDIWTYSKDDCLLEYALYKNDEKIWQRYVHEYRANCELSKTTQYNGRNKAKHVWTYDCKQEGEQLTKKKDTDQVCRWEEISPGILTKVYQTFDEKGRTIKNVSKYTLADTLILERTQYDKNDKLMFKGTYDKDFKKPLVHESFKKGKLRYRWENRYENDLIVFRSYYSRGKQQRRSEYIYNDENLLAEYNYFGSKGELRKSIKLDYP